MMLRTATHAVLGHARRNGLAREELVHHMAAASRTWTIDDVHALPDDGNRYEVIDGELFVTPAPSLVHQRAVFELAGLLRDYLAPQHFAEVLIGPADVVFSPGRAVQPDLFVLPLIAGRRAKAFADVGRLLLAVEVLSTSTARADRVHKRRLYREERVGEYWIIDLDARVIERSTPADPRVDVFGDMLTWRPDEASAPFTFGVVDYLQRVLDD